MILTYKIRHGRDFSHELMLARKVAEYAIRTKSRQGIPVFYIEPQYTSQRCSRCGHIEQTNR